VAFERASGQPLHDFFKQWLNRAGGPTVTLAAADMAGPRRLQLVLEQSAPAYALRVPVELIFPGRSELRWIDVARPREVVSLDLNAPPEGVRVDPNLRLWRVLERDQLPPILRQWYIARTPRIVMASASADMREAADALAQKLFETPPQTASLADTKASGTPLMLVGLHADIDAALARGGLPPRPANLSGKGSAQVWTVVQDGGAPVAVVSADNASALRALLRPLPHYGAQSWVVFDGSRALARGTWPAPGKLVPVRARP